VGNHAPRAVLVDGYNVLHAIPRFAPRGGDLSAARERFESWLSQAAAEAGVRECVLVWDGRDGQQRRVGPVTVLYTGAGVSADDRLLALCRGAFAARARFTWVVSSDRDVQGPARQLGFAVLGAMSFYQRWSSRTTSGSAAGPAISSPAEVDALLDAFLKANRGPR
jgi:predicted RNA-binding protein with PIN domain